MVAGCPPKYTPERLASILVDIRNRIPYELAAEGNGICEDTLYDWLKTGKKDKAEGIDSPLAKFSESIKRIEIERIAHHLTKIDANVDRWQADAWILERRWYKYFGANVQLKDMDERVKKVEHLMASKDDPNATRTQEKTS